MELLRRPLLALCATLALVALVAVPAFSADRELPASAAASAKPAKATVAACKSGAYYSGRRLSFRAQISRQQLDVPQKLAVKVSIYKRNLEGHKTKLFSREKAWNSASDMDAGIYQHDVIVDSSAIETWATYRAKVVFRWSNAVTGAVEAKKTVWSKACKQRARLPKLRLTWTGSVQVPGQAQWTHTFSVANTGRSEVTDAKISIFNDNATAGSLVAPVKIDSIGPKQTATASITAPSCAVSATARLFPPFPLRRKGVLLSDTAVINTCS
jgi:hypothetical protein